MGPSLLPALFLQLGLVATPTTITEVGAVREGGQLAVTIKADAAIEPASATAKLTNEGHLYLYVRDARVTEGNRWWGEGPSEIRAHRHKHQVELVVPLGESGCQGPVTLDRSPAGLRALVSCEEGAPPRVGRPSFGSTSVLASTSASASAPRVVVAVEPKVAPKSASAARPAVKPEAVVRAPERDAVALKAALVLQPPAAARETAVKKAQASAGVVSPASTPTQTPTQTPTVATGATTAATVATAAAGTTPAPLMPALQAGSSGGGRSGGIVLAGLLLCGLAAGAFFFARRRVKGSRYVTILETASLGPKRAIIVARVGEATMVLGSSEAGITVLQSLPEAASERRAVARAAGGDVDSDLARAGAAARNDPRDDGHDHDHDHDHDRPDHRASDAGAGASHDEDLDQPAQGGLLARFFRAATPANDSSASSSSSSSAQSFEALLEDSLEDQELRRKLSLGLAGRTR